MLGGMIDMGAVPVPVAPAAVPAVVDGVLDVVDDVARLDPRGEINIDGLGVMSLLPVPVSSPPASCPSAEPLAPFIINAKFDGVGVVGLYPH